ncbi:MAG: guanylate kinase [Candidatus Magasanikbacteria bacterium]
MSGKLVVVSAPSGTGKTTIVQKILEILPNTARLITTTTREKRPGEVEGKDYYFVTKEDFVEKIGKGEFLEYNQYAGNSYGTEKVKLEELQKQYDFVFAVIDVNGKMNLDALHIPNISIFILPESLEVLRARIEKRASLSQEQLEQRLDEVRTEIDKGKGYDYQVINREGKMEETVEEILAFLEKKDK